jgi:hypothetical protein
MRNFYEDVTQGANTQPVSAFTRLTESVEYIVDVRNSVTVYNWLKFAEYYSECFAEQQIVAVQSQVR